MAKRKQAENFDNDEDELVNLFDDELSPPKKRVMTPGEAWDAIEQQKAALTKSQTPISELDRVPSMDDIIEMPPQKAGTRKMRKNGKARKMKTKKSRKSNTRKSRQRRHKNRRTR